MRALPAVGALVFVALLGCEAVIGADFSRTDECDPLTDQCPKNLQCIWNSAASKFQCQSPASKPLTIFDSCTEDVQCGEDLACVALGGAKPTLCLPYCTTNSQCEPSKCFQFEGGRVTRSGTNIGACAPLDPPCDPFATDNGRCPSGNRCYLANTDVTVCLSQRSFGTQGESCGGIGDCAPGFTCFVPGTCRLVCDVDNPPMSCTCEDSLYRFGGTKIGFCQ